jgi:MFS family permease
MLSGIVVLLYPFARTVASVYFATAIWAATSELFRPASLAAITHVVTAERRKSAYAVNRLAINLGMSIGPALGGFLATVSFRSMFVVDGGTTILAALVLMLTKWSAPTGGTRHHAESDHPRRSTILRDRKLLVFLIAEFLVAVVFYQHESTLSLFLVNTLNFSPAFYGALFTINTLLIVALEVPINQATAHWPAAWALLSGCILFALGFGGLAIVATASGVLVTVVLWTFGEMMLFPAMAAYLGDIAPAAQRGAYMGAYSMSLSLALTFGPWVGTQILATWGPTTLWLIMFGFGALAAALMVYATPRRQLLHSPAVAEF